MIQKKYNKDFTHSLVLHAIIILLLLCTNEITGQSWKLRRYEVGFGLGTSQIFGDIGGTINNNNLWGLRDLQFSETRPALHILMRYKFSNTYSGKVNLFLGRGSGSNKTSGLLRPREYKATIFEFSGNFEYYFLRELRQYRSYATYRHAGMRNNFNVFSAYVFTGAGITYSYSTHTYIDMSESIDEYKTGSNFIPVIPIGLGLKYIVDDRWTINGELGYRYTLSDFVDGYTQNISSKYNDVYYFFDISIVYRLNTSRRNIPAIFDMKLRRVGGR